MALMMTDFPDMFYSHTSIGPNPVQLTSQSGSVGLSAGFGPGDHMLQLVKQLSEFRQQEHLCDITIKTKDGTNIPAHRVILSSASPYFNALFSSSFADSASSVHELAWMSTDTAKVVVQFMYTGKILLDYSKIANMLAAAEFLMLPQLKQHCVSFMKSILGANNVCSIKYLSDLYQLDELKTNVDDILTNSACAEIFDDVHLCELPFHFIHSLILDQRFKHLREVDLVESILRWVLHDEEARAEHLPCLMRCVLYECLPSWYIDKLREDVLTRDLVNETVLLKSAAVSTDSHTLTKDTEVLAAGSTSHGAAGCSDDVLLEIENRSTSIHDMHDEDMIMVIISGTSTPFVGYIPKQDEWVSFSPLPRQMDMRRKGLKPVCIDKKLYLLITMEESMAWLPSAIHSGLIAVQFWCLDIETNTWTELSTPRSSSKCYNLQACGNHILALGISGTLERYDHTEKEWVLCTPPNHTIAFFDTLKFSDGELLYVLNVYSTSYQSVSGNCLQIYDPATDTWSSVGLRNDESDLVVLTYRLPDRQTTVRKHNGVLQLFNTFGQHWADIKLTENKITCWKWKNILPQKIYSGHGWAIQIPDLDSLFVLNSSNNQSAMFDFDTGFIKLTARCPVQVIHGKKTGCRTKISAAARNNLVVHR